MEATATAQRNHLRMAPRKVRLVADLVRGRNVDEADQILRFAKQRASGPVRKLVNSAAANAEHNLEQDRGNLYIAEIRVDEGPALSRVMPRARGRADIIQKKTSHITVTLAERT